MIDKVGAHTPLGGGALFSLKNINFTLSLFRYISSTSGAICSAGSDEKRGAVLTRKGRAH